MRIPTSSAHGRLQHPLLEILLPAREVGRVLGRHALKPGQNVPRDDDAVHRIGMNVRIAVLVNVPSERLSEVGTSSRWIP